MTTLTRHVRAPRGTALSCKGWPQEAALRMLMNNLDPEVAERPDDLIVYGGSGKAARNWECFEAIVARAASARGRRDAARAVGQAGRRLPDAPGRAARPHRQLAARAGVGDLGELPRPRAQGPHDVRPDDGRQLDLHRHAGHPAGHLRDARLAGRPPLRRQPRGPPVRHRRPRRHGRGPAAGRDDERRRGARRRGGPAPHRAAAGHALRGRSRRSLDEALDKVAAWQRERRARSIALLGNAADVLPELVGAGHHPRRADRPDLGARRAERLRAERPHPREAARLRAEDPDEYVRRSVAAMGRTWRRCSSCSGAARVTFDYGNNIRAQAQKAGVADAFDIPGFVPEYIRPLFCEGKGPFRWAALSGDPADIHATDRAALEMFADNAALCRWIRLAARARRVPGPAGAHLLARLRRARRASASRSTSWCAAARSRRRS